MVWYYILSRFAAEGRSHGLSLWKSMGGTTGVNQRHHMSFFFCLHTVCSSTYFVRVAAVCTTSIKYLICNAAFAVSLKESEMKWATALSINKC